MYIRRVVLGEEWGPLSWVIRALLIPESLVYVIGLKIYLALCRIGVRRRCRLPVPVISVGNLTFGGTGKTPAVIAMCRMLTGLGKKAVVLSRGHGGTARGTLVVSDGANVLCSVDESGDEPMLLARALPGVPIIVDKDRRRSGRLACGRFKPDVILLDDGLQYWQLHRDLDIVVVSARKPFGSGFVMPAGDLREPVSGLRRAGLLLVTGAESVTDANVAALKERLSKLAPSAAVFCCRHRPTWLGRIVRGDSDRRFAEQAVGDGNRRLQPKRLAGRKVLAFCGIGSPESFAATLSGLGAQVLRLFTFPDHHRYSEADLDRVSAAKGECGAEIIVTTEKDAARLFWDEGVPKQPSRGEEAPRRREGLEDIYVLGIELEIEQPDRLAQHVADRLDRANSPVAAEKTAH